MSRVRVLIIGLEPSLIDFTLPAYAAFPGMTADKVRSALQADATRLSAFGYDIDSCLTDFGATAEQVVREKLSKTSFDCIVIGAGVRMVAENTPLFEKLINVVHVHAPQARLCFNTGPSDNAEAIGRWFPAV
jgi:hypothetical protein